MIACVDMSTSFSTSDGFKEHSELNKNVNSKYKEAFTFFFLQHKVALFTFSFHTF